MKEQADPIYEYFVMLGGFSNKYDKETSKRVFEFTQELATKRNYQKFTTFKSESDEMIIGNHLRLFSICEHHLLPFFGEVAIGYIPNGKIFGLSKLQRIVDAMASKPQIQENLTRDILQFINYLVKPKGIAVRVKAIHTCVFARGVQSTNAEFTTTSVFGVLKEDLSAKNEFLQSVGDDKIRI